MGLEISESKGIPPPLAVIPIAYLPRGAGQMVDSIVGFISPLEREDQVGIPIMYCWRSIHKEKAKVSQC